MDNMLLLHQQKKIRDLAEKVIQAQREADEWRERAEAIHQEYMELSEQIRRGEFVKAKK
ncbi:hypothetical protein LPW11_07880 [Geomonas sp. RF6]|uniref:hypothetical protein n=1 Tax=Geomonas sp. RF6 TaxID=2897342 RepID=UPI001E38705C|nr:hypothetical protein [Geomonas sp. RF6]UFS72100.1 hypothetical protein LPW11_07880 [Geomonas sp. RF6]